MALKHTSLNWFELSGDIFVNVPTPLFLEILKDFFLSHDLMEPESWKCSDLVMFWS